MSDPRSQHHVAALLWICGENLDEDLINQKLGLTATPVGAPGNSA